MTSRAFFFVGFWAKTHLDGTGLSPSLVSSSMSSGVAGLRVVLRFANSTLIALIQSSRSFPDVLRMARCSMTVVTSLAGGGVGFSQLPQCC